MAESRFAQTSAEEREKTFWSNITKTLDVNKGATKISKTVWHIYQDKINLLSISKLNLTISFLRRLTGQTWMRCCIAWPIYAWIGVDYCFSFDSLGKTKSKIFITVYWLALPSMRSINPIYLHIHCSFPL